MIRDSMPSCFIVIVALLVGRPMHAMESEQEKFALVKDTEIILLDGDQHELARLASDTRPKGGLRWAPGGQRLAYKVKDDAGARSRLVVIDLKGQILKEIAIQPVTDPPSFQFRDIQNITWQTAHTVRVYGSINNWNCGIFDLDVDTGRQISGQFGQCRDFVDSPDGKHVAYLGLTSGGPDEERPENVEIDADDLAYRGPPGVFQVVTGPVWSEDSKRVAFIHKTARTGESALGVLSIDGKSDRFPLPSHFDTEASLIWLGDDIAIRDEAEMIVVSHARKQRVRASAELVSKVERSREAKSDAPKMKQESARAMRELLEKIGAREGVVRPE